MPRIYSGHIYFSPRAPPRFSLGARLAVGTASRQRATGERQGYFPIIKGPVLDLFSDILAQPNFILLNLVKAPSNGFAFLQPPPS